MKKTAAILAAIACMSLSATTAFATRNTGDGNIINNAVHGAEDVVNGVVRGAEDVVEGVGSGAEEILTPGASNSVPETTTPIDTSIPGTTESGNVNNNVNTGVPALELAALGAAAVGGLSAMAVTVRRKK